MNRIKEHLDECLKEVKIDDELYGEILNKIEAEDREEAAYNGKTAGTGQRKKDAKRKYYRRIGAAAAVLFFCMTSVTVLGAAVPAVQNWIFRISPEVAGFLYPIEESCEKEGIRLSVVAGVNDEHNAEIYFTLQDTEGKGRVSDKADLMDSAGINGSTLGGVEFLNYEEETQTAFYVIHESGNYKSRRNVFRINEMMFNKTIFEWFQTEINLADLAGKEPKTEGLSEYDYGGGSSAGMDTSILVPDVMSLSLGEEIDFMTISNIGMVDGKLHIQTKWDRSFDNHGEFWLLERGKEPEEYSDSVPHNNYYFRTEEDLENTGNGYFSNHIEFVYDIGAEELDDYVLWARIVKDGQIVKGSWQVSFSMGDMEKTVLEPETEVADRISITPMSIYVEGFKGNAEECEAFLKMKDGSRESFFIKNINGQEYGGADTGKETGEWDINFVTRGIVETGEIEAVVIDGKEIPVKP